MVVQVYDDIEKRHFILVIKKRKKNYNERKELVRKLACICKIILDPQNPRELFKGIVS
ncbi:hypothetical protein BH09BAC3_BH09BAC3_23070 [soil metagenome]